MTTISAALAPLLDVVPLTIQAGVEEDGYDLWLRYRPLREAARSRVRNRAIGIVMPAETSLTALAALAELHHALRAMLGAPPPLLDTAVEGALVLATPDSMPALAELGLPLVDLGAEGFLLRATRIDGVNVTLIAANADIGLLYGAFAWLRAVGSGADLEALDQASAPRIERRMLNHWDNLDRSVERGYAGESIWDWWTLPEVRESRYADYARANASLGINGTVLNNVNARIEILTAPWIAKAAALADIFRPYGIRVYLAVRFSSPAELGETATADPLDPEVRAWWREKAAEIYLAIPDFGGFLVKANSEGQPGPHDYGRSHADGANLLAEALAPHGGLCVWRAFVYSEHDADDRARQAYTEFAPLDGTFAPNVAVQVKNGPIDFQPREPFHPLFGAMARTPLFLEFQVTKEYLGFSTHLAYLGPLFEEVLRSDTHRGTDWTVAAVTEGSAHGRGPTGIAGVANIGSHRTWCGSHFDAANWYAFGRLAWDPHARSADIAHEWVALTFSITPGVAAPIVEMMMASREAVVDYMTPLGLHHLMATGHHHGPGPWVADLGRDDWNPVYYHRADAAGIGFDRTASGSNAIAQYAPVLAERFADPATTPEALLLWFHHLSWDYRMPSGATLWEELVARYDRGVQAASALRERWDELREAIDARRHREIGERLQVQEREARWWRDASVAYFQSIARRPLPAGTIAPELPLEAYQALHFPYAPGRGLPPRP